MGEMGLMKYDHFEMASAGCTRNVITSRSIYPEFTCFADLSDEVVAK